MELRQKRRRESRTIAHALAKMPLRRVLFPRNESVNYVFLLVSQNMTKIKIVRFVLDGKSKSLQD